MQEKRARTGGGGARQPITAHVLRSPSGSGRRRAFDGCPALWAALPGVRGNEGRDAR